jgi:SAM-dependent methyltransferase
MTSGSEIRERWNHNLHYHPLVLETVPERCARALDVGCGEGTLARELRRRAAHVTAIDLDAAGIELARRGDTGRIAFVHGDFLSYPFEPASFDFIASVACVHHMDMRAALERMVALLRPGGTLAVVGLARSRLPADLPHEIAAAIGHRLYGRRRTYWEHPSPKL